MVARELLHKALDLGLVANTSGTTIWRWLCTDAIRFWCIRSWLNQMEIYFSSIQPKAPTANDFTTLGEVENRLLRFHEYYEVIE